MSDAMTKEGMTGLPATLYACRDATRWMLGKRYPERMADLGSMLSNIATARGCCVVRAATEAAHGADGVNAMELMAAAVELLEPST